MTIEEITQLADEVFDENYSELNKKSFILGFQEAYNALTVLYKDKFILIKNMREAQKKIENYSPLKIENERCQWENDLDNKIYLETEVDEMLHN